MTTLRREMRSKIFDLLELAYQDNPPTEHARDYNKEQAEKIADVLIEIRAFKPNMAKASLDWLAAGVDVTQEELDKEAFEEKALHTFETDMGCPKNWTWYPARTSEEAAWRILREFVVEKYTDDPKCFQTYKTWSTTDYARGAMGVLAIKRNPENFPASWQDFLSANPSAKNGRVATKVDKSGTPITY